MPSTLRVTQLAEPVRQYTTSVVRLDAAQLDQITLDDAPTTYNRKRMERVLKGETSWASSWMGNIGSLENARALFSQGWQDGGERAALLRDQISDAVPASTAPVRKRRVRDDGDELRIEQALRGEWDTAWWSMQKEQAPTPTVVSLTTGWIAMCTIPHADLIWNAVQAIVICDLLEANGYRVELRALDAVRIDRRALHFTELTMKRASDVLQPDLIAATIGHAGVYRSLGFAAMCCHPTDTNFELGHNPDPSTRQAGIDAAIAAGVIDPISYHLPRADSERQCVANITHVLGELRVALAA